MKRAVRFTLLCGLVAIAACLPRLAVLRTGDHGPEAIMLLHGYGSDAEHWLPYTKTIPFKASTRLLFPQAPFVVGRTDGAPSGRAWWHLDLAAHRREDRLGVDLSTENPAGLDHAAKMVRAALVNEGSTPAHPFVLGGFSQGAMVSCQVAFATDTPLAALLILSGTTINLDEWKRGFARRKGLPIFMAHGRSDGILPFDLAETLHQAFVTAGMNVTFVSFAGDHEIPREVVVALGEFLDKLGMGRR